MLRLGEQGKSYCAETSLHGLKYITEDDRHIVERVIWIVLFTCAMCLMISFMIPGIQKYQNNPTSTGLDTKDYPIMNIEFPGITICPNTKIMKSTFRVAMQSSHLPWKNLTKSRGPEYQYKLLTYLNNMVKFSVDPRSLEKIDDEELDGILNDMKGDVAKLMGMVAPSCKRMALICRWQGEYRNCSEMFKVTKTDNGFCCSFNTISVSEGFAKAPEEISSDDEPAAYDYAFYDPDFGFFDPGGPALPWEDTPIEGEAVGGGALDGEVGNGDPVDPNTDTNDGVGGVDSQDNSGTQDSNGDNSGTQDSNGDNSGTQDSNGDNSGTQDSNGDNSGTQDSNGDNSGTQDSNGDNSGTQDSNGDNSGTQDSNGDNSGTQDSNGDDSGAQDSNGDNGSNDDTQNSDPAGAPNTAPLIDAGVISQALEAHESCKPLIESINKAGTARWYTGCYVNDEDQCFDKKLTNELNPLDSLTELESSLRAYPVPADFKLRKQAHKTNGASSKLGLSILLDPMLHDQINAGLEFEGRLKVAGSTDNFFQGWKIHIHDPHEFPEVSRKGIHVGIGKEVEISLSAETLIADENVKDMAPTRRKCLLTNEIDVPDMHTMQLFTEYKKSSCQLECKAMSLIKKYNCLPYFFPEPPKKFIKQHLHLKEGQSIFCSSDQLRRMADNIDKYTAINNAEGSNPIKGLNCGHCPDQCEAIDYKYRATVADFTDGGDYFYRALMRKGNATHPALNKYLIKEYEQYILELFGSNVEVLGPPLSLKDPRPEMKSCLEKTIRKKISKMTWMHIYFSENGVVKYSRTVTYGWQDLIGFFGGIVGLCVGFSLLSGAEMIYFFTIRLIFDMKKEKKNKVAEDVESVNTETETMSEGKIGKEVQSEYFDALFALDTSTLEFMKKLAHEDEKNHAAEVAASLATPVPTPSPSPQPPPEDPPAEQKPEPDLNLLIPVPVPDGNTKSPKASPKKSPKKPKKKKATEAPIPEIPPDEPPKPEEPPEEPSKPEEPPVDPPKPEEPPVDPPKPEEPPVDPKPENPEPTVVEDPIPQEEPKPDENAETPEEPPKKAPKKPKKAKKAGKKAKPKSD